MHKQTVKFSRFVATALIIGSWFFGTLPTALAAEATDGEVSTVYNSKVHFRPILHTHGVEFRWFRYATPKVFVRYEIIRSSNKPAKNIIQDGVVAGETTNRYSTNFEEKLDAGTYYYQLCSVTKVNRVCSKVVTVKITSKLPAEMMPIVVSTSTEQLVSYQAAPSGQLQLTVVRDSMGTAFLSWTPFIDSGNGFKWYKPVRSDAVDPYYPRDGYLAHLPYISHTAFVDIGSVTGTVNYRICAVDGQDGLWCGNVVASTK
ncbi:MAG: hypothetical protein WC551_04465 [Patescibacteria group bacterium]